VAHRDRYSYHFKRGNTVLHGGSTDDVERREQQHRDAYGGRGINQIGRRRTKEAARKWEEEGGKR
jgi:predicted GIY-YIG superfamily endonuclease